MSKRKSNAPELRRLAAEFLDSLSEIGDLFPAEKDDLITSLVRQWTTYDGAATLFLGEVQFYATLAVTPLGKRYVVPQVVEGWGDLLIRDWKNNPDDMPELLDQLNRGQSVETTNLDGVTVRLSVNPRQRKLSVEPLNAHRPPGPHRPDFRKFATDALQREFHGELDPEELAQLADSVARQWIEYDCHACVFVGPRARPAGRRLCLPREEQSKPRNAFGRSGQAGSAEACRVSEFA